MDHGSTYVSCPVSVWAMVILVEVGKRTRVGSDSGSGGTHVRTPTRTVARDGGGGPVGGGGGVRRRGHAGRGGRSGRLCPAGAPLPGHARRRGLTPDRRGGGGAPGLSP